MIPVPAQVLEALAVCFHLHSQDLTPIGGGREDSDGIVYAFNQGRQQRVLKVLALPSGDVDGLVRVQERLKFIKFLGENGVNIVYPIPLESDGLLAALPSTEHTFVAYVMERVSGSHPKQDQWTDGFYRAWGKTVGHLHRVTQQYPSWRRSLIDEDNGKSVLGWEEEWQGFYTMAAEPQMKDQWLAMRERLEQLPIERSGFGFIHNDPHINNLLVDDGRITLLDFDVANYHWFINDIAIAMQSLLFATTGGMERPVTSAGPLKHFITTFMAGYETENHLDPAWRKHIDLFISYRRLLLFTVMQGWLSTQPALRSSWWEMIVSNRPVTGLN